MYGHIDILKILILDYKADITTKDINDFSGLEAAFIYNNLEII